ncbi:putative GTP-binding protein EngB [Companilactobacillus sp. RD055328]|uniref:ribosome biogenesis GTP-binding protein YihA/YsxC n=1 Tax=Companilactobacillus sp. RD055328 TaxID=2916634 RepID=UPI001FC8CEE1|nr:ribosome biogenesis GTP-binding protein YihA/YsxC [Companilactobacillus sp. RD055328]GKQ42803.1 putative GTP-binding protein EngB [Companilactobacillus sp. RD055328]
MKVNNVSMNMSAVSSKQYPTEGYPEIALAGRSNVGKSSLINTLINRNSFARTSSKPGKTQQLNFYNIEEQLYLVDVPGYGYAKVSKKQREEFGVMIEEYLTTRKPLKGIVILVDGRHEPSEDDISMYDFVRYYKIPVLIVATKMDKVKGNQWNKSESIIRKTMQIDETTDFQIFSAETKYGKDQVWQWIEAHM